MTIQIPMLASFRVLRASMSCDLEMRDGAPCLNHGLHLILLAERNTRIQLSSGESLSEVELHFSVSTKWRTTTELDAGLTAHDVGFLSHNQVSNGKAFVHGAALWPNEQLPQYLLAEQLKRNAHFSIASLPTLSDSSPPHSWATGREHFLRLSSVQFSVCQGEG